MNGPQINFMVAAPLAIRMASELAAGSLGDFTRGGRARRLALDPWLISCAPAGHSVSGCADNILNLCFICVHLWLNNLAF